MKLKEFWIIKCNNLNEYVNDDYAWSSDIKEAYNFETERMAINFLNYNKHSMRQGDIFEIIKILKALED